MDWIQSQNRREYINWFTMTSFSLSQTIYFRNLVGRLGVLVVMFFFLFTVPLKVLPGVGTRMIVSCLGCSVLLYTLADDLYRARFRLRTDLLALFGAIALLVVVSALACFFNQTSDFSFVKFAFSLLLNCLAGYFVLWMINNFHAHITFSIISIYLIVACLLQVMLSFWMFIDPGFRTWVLAVLEMGEFMETLVKATEEHRLIPVGPNPFPVSIALGFSLMLIVVVGKRTSPTFSSVLLYTLVFLLIAGVGAMIGRTTLIGAAFALLLLILPRRHHFVSWKKGFVFLLLSVCTLIATASIMALFVLEQETLDMLSASAEFGFEVMINYINGEGIQSASTNELYTMFIWPERLSTYLIGDGLFASPSNPVEYYMGTDVGYLRLIYYFGIPGLLCFFAVQFFPLANILLTGWNDGAIRSFFIMQFFFMIILNIKGYSDLLYLNILFMFALSYLPESLGNEQVPLD
jgi:hypothetical protein